MAKNDFDCTTLTPEQRDARLALDVERLLRFGRKHKLIKELDELVARNTLLDLLQLAAPSETKPPKEDPATPAALLDEMEKGIARETGENAALPGLASGLVYAGATLRTMRAAPVVILVLNTNAASPFEAGTPESRFMAMYDDLAVGAAMQNLLIRAAELGLGTLWIGNTGYAYEELIRFVGTEHRLVGAVALGWPDEAPKARPRKPLADVMEWREE